MKFKILDGCGVYFGLAYFWGFKILDLYIDTGGGGGGQKNILKTKSNFTLLIYIHFLGIGEWYFKCV